MEGQQLSSYHGWAEGRAPTRGQHRSRSSRARSTFSIAVVPATWLAALLSLGSSEAETIVEGCELVWKSC